MTTTPTIWKSFTANLNSLPGEQFLPTVTAFADGSFLVTWTDDTSGSSPSFDQFAQRFDAEGNPKGQSFQLNTVSTAKGEFDGKVAALPDGGFVHIYIKLLSESDATFNDRDLVLERRDASGRVVFTETLHKVPAGFGYDIAVGANGDYSVQFAQVFDEDWGIDIDLDAFGFIYDFETNVRGERFSAGRNASETDFMQSTAGLAGGGFASVTTRVIGNTEFVVAKAVDGDGQTVMQPLTLGAGNRADVAALTGGNFAVTYQRDGDIFFRVINPEGGPSPEFAAAQSGNNEFIPAITHLHDGGFFIAWFDFDSKTVLGQRFDASGAVVGGTVVAASVPGLLALIEIAASLASDGRILLSISDGNTDIREVILDPRDDAIFGAGGNDVITTRITATTVFAGAGDDKVLGQSGADVIHGGDGNDTLQGGRGVDTINGDAGNDIIVLREGDASDHVNGGAGFDRLDLQLVTSRAAVVDLGTGAWAMTPGFAEDTILIGPPTKSGPPPTTIPVVARSITGIESVNGTAKGDRITGSAANETFYGRDGDDTLSGAGGVDKLHGMGGNDILDGGADNDILWGAEGDDILMGGAGADKLIGGAGFDAADYSKALVQVSADLQAIAANTGDALGDTYNSVEILRGSNLAAGIDRLRGDAGGNVIQGLAGNDQIDSKSGNDRIEGGLGADTMRGDLGDDTFSYASAAEGGDSVLDFTSNTVGNNDSFAFSAAGFGSGLAAGALAANQFEANAAGVATLSTTRFVYDTDNFRLSFDANGSGLGGATVVATLQAGATLAIDDISIF